MVAFPNGLLLGPREGVQNPNGLLSCSLGWPTFLQMACLHWPGDHQEGWPGRASGPAVPEASMVVGASS